MTKVFKGIILSMAIISLSINLICGLMYLVGARINISNSIPKGLYWISKAAVVKGEYVIFCPPGWQVFEEARDRGYINSGFCPGGYGYMMKKILAAKGDNVLVTPDGVTVNGQLLPCSKPLLVDGFGKSLPYLIGKSYALSEYEMLLMTDRSEISFDARYFGPIHKSQIKSVIRPGFTW